MNPGASELFDTTSSSLHAQGPLKTWSLIVTIFGDIAPAKEEHLDSQLLAALTAPFGVKPEALRVALHRLRKDGWLEAVKRGRRSAYHLSATGEALTRAAYAQIYRVAPVGQGSDWQIELLEDATTAKRAGSAVVAPNILVSPAGTATGALCMRAGDVPAWMRASLTSAETSAEFALYTEALTELVPKLSTARLDARQKLALRLLVLHHWRRIVLRQPEVHEALLGESWAGHKARQLTLEVFATLGRPALTELAALQNA